MVLKKSLPRGFASAFAKSLRVQSASVFLVVIAWQSYNLTLPSFWADESATISAATRSLGNILKLTERLDAVHGLYYLFMHFWLQLFSVSHLTLRLPEAIAIALSATLVFVILKQRTSTIAALLATLIFAAMPAIVWAGGVGRSYAFTVLLATALIFVGLKLAGQTSQADQAGQAHRAGQTGQTAKRRFWLIAYFVIASLACLIFIFMILFVLAELAALLVLKQSNRRRLTLALVTFAAVLTSAPVLMLAKNQTKQVAWIKVAPTDPANAIFSSVLFNSETWLTLAIWGLVAVGAGLFAMQTLRRRKLSSIAIDAKQPHNGALFAICLWLALAPSLTVLAYSSLTTPLFVGRYFLFTASAVAILVGLALHAIKTQWVLVTFGLLIMVLAIAPSLAVRQNYAFSNNDNDKVAATIAQDLRHGDAILFEPHHAPCTGLCATSVGYAGLLSKGEIIGLKGGVNRHRQIYDRYLPFSKIAKQAKTYDRIWFVHKQPANTNFQKKFESFLAAKGYRLRFEKVLAFESVTLYSK